MQLTLFDYYENLYFLLLQYVALIHTFILQTFKNKNDGNKKIKSFGWSVNAHTTRDLTRYDLYGSKEPSKALKILLSSFYQNSESQLLPFFQNLMYK